MHSISENGPEYAYVLILEVFTDDLAKADVCLGQ